MTSRSYNELYLVQKNAFIAAQDKVNDLNEGSVISCIFEAVARVVERLYIDTRIGYNNNLKAIPYSIFDFKRKEGVKATSVGKFIASKTLSVDTIIYSGTKVSSGSLVYSTTENAVIKAGELESNIVGIQADNIGLEYNIAAGTITNISSILTSNVASFTNTEKAAGGTDKETETEMLSRFKKYINGLQGTNSYGMESKVLATTGVRSVSVVEHFPPQNSFNFSIYVDDGTGGLSEDLKEEIKTVVNGEKTSTNPGCRAAGVNVRIAPASPIPITVNVKCMIYRTEHAQAEYDIEEKIKSIVNNLVIGENLLLTSLILGLRQISYVRDVSNLSIQGYTGNVTVSKEQICRYLATNLTLEDVDNDN